MSYELPEQRQSNLIGSIALWWAYGIRPICTIPVTFGALPVVYFSTHGCDRYGYFFLIATINNSNSWGSRCLHLRKNFSVMVG